MDQQLELWTAAPPQTDRPRCAMCARPAHRNQRTGEPGRYCTHAGCANRKRLCQACGAEFDVGINGAGTKYCSSECKRLGYSPGPAPLPRCTWCGTTATAPRTGRSAWPYICTTCTEPIRHLLTRLKDHHVPAELARRLLTDPTCEICGIDIVTKRPDPVTKKLRALLVVDHDHDCCTGAHSCGSCIRGLICRVCNVGLGAARNDTKIMQAMITYLNVYGHEDDA